MKRPILIFICLIGLVWPGCEKNPAHSNNNSYKQKQIDWPSLADSPWPMWGHDPQWTYRSQYVGPSGCDTLHVYRHTSGIMWESGLLIGMDDNVYYTTSWDTAFNSSLGKKTGVITKLDSEYQIIWQMAVSYESIYESGNSISVVPVLSTNGVFVFGSDRSLTRIAKNGSIENRIIINQNCPKWALQIDKEGNLFWANNGASSYTADGELRWENLERSFTFIGPFSPQGDQIYISSRDSLFALGANNGNILWSRYGKGSISVNCDGKIYTLTDSTLLALESDGSLDWEISLLVNDAQYFSGSTNIAIGPEGNLYFDISKPYSDDSPLIISVSPKGNIRWVYQPGVSINAWIIADAAGNIYTYLTDGRIFSLDSNGLLRWSTQIFNDYVGELQIAINSQGKLIISAVRSQELQGIIEIY
ncbi:PQQ-binding-like beta-propeller repeat protein [bacterium]|nr:PQQ-binding-like beta-propeller repeat protein [bacterium]